MRLPRNPFAGVDQHIATSTTANTLPSERVEPSTWDMDVEGVARNIRDHVLAGPLIETPWPRVELPCDRNKCTVGIAHLKTGFRGLRLRRSGIDQKVEPKAHTTVRKEVCAYRLSSLKRDRPAWTETFFFGPLC